MHRRRYEYGHEVLVRAALVLSLVLFAAMVLSWFARGLPTGVDIDPHAHMGTTIPAPLR